MAKNYFYDPQRAFDFLNSIGFVRMGGTPEELKAAEMIRDDLLGDGIDARIEDFVIQDVDVNTATLEVLEPYAASYTVTAYKGSGCADALEADFIYVEDATEADLVDAKGKIALVNGFLRLPLYKKLVDAGVAAFVTMSGDMLDKMEESDLFTRTLRAPLRTQGVIPGVNLRVCDAFDLVNRGASRVRLSVNTKLADRTSHNVVAVIPGTASDEEICFTAHYDSVEFSTGVYDNGAGSVILMELARWFAKNPARRTLKFIWTGSEEIGLEGSKAYVRDHAAELDKCRFMINVDVGGSVLGKELCSCTADETVTTFTDTFMKINGYRMAVSRDIYSSDNMPFADLDVPAASFFRVGAPGAGHIHDRNDVISLLSAKGLEKTILYVMDYADTLANAVVFPFERKVPADMHEKIDNYFYKKEQEEAMKKAEAEAK